ncbi:MAG TPA: hypothetical protein VEM13_04635 [Gemmatimonadales bacterium]|nr:hypothetical protein [Gemmatimonadales bacterium]
MNTRLTHNALREGARLGLVVATGIWLWIALVDVLARQPFHTFTVLGGVVPFTVLHYVLNAVFGVVIVTAIHGAAREPSLVIALAFGFFIVEFAFAMLTVLLSHTGLGELAWVRILGGNLIGAVIAFVILSRTHPLAAELRAAEDEENE